MARKRLLKTNVFVKPNEQSRACASYVMARKRLLKTNVFVKPNEQSRACASYVMARKRLLKTNVFFTDPPEFPCLFHSAHRPSPVLIESLGSVLLFSATAHRHPYTPAQEPRTEHLRLEISRKQTVSAMHDLHRTTRYRKIPKRIFVFSAKQGFTLFRR